MKRNLFVAGMAALAMTSCTNEDVVNIPESKGIAFGSPYVGTSVRAAEAPETDLEALKAENAGFYVYGAYKAASGDGDPINVFENVNVTHSGGVWGYDDVQYWGSGNVYKFAAYAPAIAGVEPTFSYGTNGAVNDCLLTFTDVKIDGTNQIDLVVGKSAVITAQDKDNPKVTLPMKHVLSMVKVTLTNGFRDGIRLTITDFKVNGVKTTGTFTQVSTASTAGDAGTWDTSASQPETTSTFTDAGNSPLNTNGATYENSFVMIPQAVAANAVTVTFTAELKDANGGLVDVGEGNNPRNFTIILPAGAWGQNLRYNYTATIDGSTFGMNEIQFGDPEVGAWADYTETPVDIQ